MSILKRKKSNTGKVVATVVGGAVAAGVAYLATTKKGKAMVKDAKKEVSSLVSAAERKEKKLERKVRRTLGKARTAVKRAKTASAKKLRSR